MSLTKLSLARNNLLIPGQGEFGSDIPQGDGKIANFFYSAEALIFKSRIAISPPCRDAHI
jgi:hypothetical protein